MDDTPIVLSTCSNAAHHAVILAGGKGTRLKPFTDCTPKPMVPLGKMPILELIIKQLVYHGFKEATLCIGHMAEQIQGYFGNGSKFGIRIHYNFEDKPLGTAGPLASIQGLPQHFLVMNADVVTDLDYANFMQQHIAQNRVATVATYQKTTQIEFGILDIKPDTNRIHGFHEKPTLVHSVCMGIYALSLDVVRLIPHHQFCGIDTLMERIMQEGLDIQAYPFEGYWLDIGRHTDYSTALRDYAGMEDRLLPKDQATKQHIQTLKPHIAAIKKTTPVNRLAT
jgi:NDP-mannose synthase